MPKTTQKKRVRRLPLDPERGNAKASKRAGEMVAEILMRRAAGADCPQSELRDYILADFLCDLAHWLDRNPKYGTMAESIDSAAGHYSAETRNEGAQFDA